MEPTLGVISACLPTMRALFHGMSPESIIGSIRSALSLRSLRSSHSGADVREHLPTGDSAAPQGEFVKLPDTSLENQITSIEMNSNRNVDGAKNGIMVCKEFTSRSDQRV